MPHFFISLVMNHAFRIHAETSKFTAAILGSGFASTSGFNEIHLVSCSFQLELHRSTAPSIPDRFKFTIPYPHAQPFR
jgi:hypothetical protein